MEQKIVFVLDINGNPLMPTSKIGKVRKWLKSGEAKIHSYEPFFVIQLTKNVQTFKQNLTLGIDAGYSFIGYSIINTDTGKEIIGGQLDLELGMSDRITAKSMYRTQRRGRLRYRKPRFDNRAKPEGWLAPSVQDKVDIHVKLINKLVKFTPISKVIIEAGNFDMAKMNNPEISGTEYQNGINKGFWNIREAVLFRDGHKCQNPNCKNNEKHPILEVHHIVYRSEGGTDSANNLITLCTKCHTSPNHKPGNLLWSWMKEKKKVRSLKDATFMNLIRSHVFSDLNCNLTIPIEMTYGYLTKSKRIENKITKTHHSDAFVIAGGKDESLISDSKKLIVQRRNNRSLETFRDTKFIDSRDGKPKSGNELNCGRRTRNKNNNSENLRKYRVPIINEKTGKRDERSKGFRSIRTEISRFPKNTKFIILDNWSSSKITVKKGEKFNSIGTQNKGAYVLINTKQMVPSKLCKIIGRCKGIINMVTSTTPIPSILPIVVNT